MSRGKDICKELKALRRRIADENQIPLETEECAYKGECSGTCPRCDAEVRYLEDVLSHRLNLGKAATVAGLALGLAVGAGVQAQNVTDTAALKPVAKEISDTVGKVRVTGVVKNAKTKEPEPFINVQAKQNGELIAGAATDFQGRYNFYLPAGEYEIEFTAVGFKKLLLQGVVIDSTKNNVELEEIILVENAISLQGVVVVKKSENPLIDKDPYGAKQTIRYDGVKVIVR